MAFDAIDEKINSIIKAALSLAATLSERRIHSRAIIGALRRRYGKLYTRLNGCERGEDLGNASLICRGGEVFFKVRHHSIIRRTVQASQQ